MPATVSPFPDDDLESVHGGSDDRCRPAQGLAHRRSDRRGRGAAGRGAGARLSTRRRRSQAWLTRKLKITLDSASPCAVTSPRPRSAWRTTVRGFVPHHLVLRHMAAVISHGGLSTITAALTAGVPLLCIPQGRDQSDNAERLAASGAARALATDAPQPGSRVRSRNCWQTWPRWARLAASPMSSPDSAAVMLPPGRLQVWPVRVHRWALGRPGRRLGFRLPGGQGIPGKR
jgi:hypothetical protein